MVHLHPKEGCRRHWHRLINSLLLLVRSTNYPLRHPPHYLRPLSLHLQFPSAVVPHSPPSPSLSSSLPLPPPPSGPTAPNRSPPTTHPPTTHPIGTTYCARIPSVFSWGAQIQDARFCHQCRTHITRRLACYSLFICAWGGGSSRGEGPATEISKLTRASLKDNKGLLPLGKL
jgi:hypothetical protein